MIDLKVYFIIVTDIDHKMEGIFSVNDNEIDIEKISKNFFNYFNGHEVLLSEDELIDVKTKIKLVTSYKVPFPDFYKNISGSKYNLCNGFVNLQTVLVDFCDFDLRKFIDRRKNSLNNTSVNFDFSEC